MFAADSTTGLPSSSHATHRTVTYTRAAVPVSPIEEEAPTKGPRTVLPSPFATLSVQKLPSTFSEVTTVGMNGTHPLPLNRNVTVFATDQVPTRGPRTSEEALARLAAAQSKPRNSILFRPGQQRKQKERVTFATPTTATQTGATDWVDLEPVRE